MNKSLKIIFIAILALFSLRGIAQDFPQRPVPPRIVNDFANFLSGQEQQALENKLVQFNNETSTQVAIVILPTLNGYDPSQYAFELGEKWGIGQKGKNNGILILVKPKTATEKGEVFIATGYGLEGAVPDALSKRIVENDILPYFRQGQYYQGLDNAVNTIISLTKGEYTADEYQKRTQGTGPFPIIIVFILIIIIAIVSRIKRARHYALGHNLPFWIAMGMLASQNRSHSGSFGNFSSGSGGFGGGGFGGFGGGSFGGGGAGGSW
ncbi:MAG: hypothetical protein A2X13_10520 [Bacteroidetes bacterium GWC2_33_15]|nr:MAG: hypothetical protein A2X10_03070 [Bacteroidetes bacterium GWA2_33_15]OFX48885.1 MAG: hypothetical protein A2X13_10520 [Bacteroidetes bacterium GWC2_33_15]OFX66137.1 MAG: hypothetical protein A2X15_11665 [Bacteroidetes bacterium GWB2_32_14]OFX68383.1 MAG: hypothetical protein A2X14_07230 [Bacteroidetes bacterium GWD2_33_33]HAN17936.1 hypothetical protein [Bacteroidales bacterium]